MTDTMCKNCGKPIHYAHGRGTKPSGPAWRHCNSGQVVCPGTFRATPAPPEFNLRVDIDPKVIDELNKIAEKIGVPLSPLVRRILRDFPIEYKIKQDLALSDNVLVKHPTEEDLHG